MGREKRARLKRWSKNTRRTCRCSHHYETSYPGRSKSLQQTTDATITTTGEESAWSCEVMHAWHGNYDAMQLIKIKRNQNPDTHIYGSSCFTTRQFKCWLAWQRQGMGELHKIKWKRGKHYKYFPYTPLVTYYVRCKLSWHDMMQNANKHVHGIFRFYSFFW
jgi:hypothetical protein